MTVAEKFQDVCANPAWLTLASALTFGPANLAVTICVLIRMLDDIDPERLLAAVSHASRRADQLASRSITARAAARLVGTMVFAPPAHEEPLAQRRPTRTARPPQVNKSQAGAGRFTAGGSLACLAFRYRSTRRCSRPANKENAPCSRCPRQ